MARRGLGKGLRAYFPDYQEENSHSELEHEVSEQDGSHGEDEHSVDRKAKLEELDMVLPGSSRKAKADSDKKKAKKREQPQAEGSWKEYFEAQCEERGENREGENCRSRAERRGSQRAAFKHCPD